MRASEGLRLKCAPFDRELNCGSHLWGFCDPGKDLQSKCQKEVSAREARFWAMQCDPDLNFFANTAE